MRRARRGGPAGHLGQRDAQGRDQRRDARLGHERRDDPLRPGLGDGPAPLPDDRPRPPATDRRRGRGAGGRGRGPAAGPRAGLRRRRLERDRAARPVHRRARGPHRGHRGRRRRDRDRPPRGGDRRRHARDPPRGAVDDAPGPRRPGRRGPFRVGRAGLPGRRAADRGARGGRPPGDVGGDRRRGVRGHALARPDRGDPARRSRRPTRSRRCRGSSPGPRAADADWPEETIVLVGFSGRGDKDLAPFGRWHEAHAS